MNSKDNTLKIEGFDPSYDQVSYLQDKIEALHHESPNESTLLADFSLKGSLYKGVVTIHSVAGKFFAVATGGALNEVTQNLVNEIRRQLRKWKAHRFDKSNAGGHLISC